MYIVHELYPLDIIKDKNGKDITNYGQRNSRVVLLGILIYIIIYVILLSAHNEEYFNYFIIIFIIDSLIMSSIHYKYFNKTVGQVVSSGRPFTAAFFPII